MLVFGPMVGTTPSLWKTKTEASRLSMCAGLVGGGLSAWPRLAPAGGVLLTGFSSATFLGSFDPLVSWTLLDPVPMCIGTGSFLYLQKLFLRLYFRL
ncbi:MAG: hypothetical protein A3G03_00230 [Candidatus Taylorbacteria bacterium RIFCSPLOWO2_12_FULL_44_15c]|uniref:Uncharacterized protein n=1 Tax=Candidatus Taylorbacteria bacterium RIFCSPLOWO2_12_FULL_44_15c TaxID=1802333 RepID=A0A1G2P481_9BACT|nr:MAG: hypothetical protein A3I97_01875 [Candidatus Taylorbacteria bacterium RIFCSPLOWO2_02_FULL_44_35]OHA43136.1 MAG: hypothetical protein A3G03_00230 [Candidatus Taylorbacteria bacterium RIFCSPLOWO2_12_FULL_44_15c]